MLAGLFALSRIQKIFGGGTLILLVVVSLWAWRVNTIRADLRSKLTDVSQAVNDVKDPKAPRVKDSDLDEFIRSLAMERDDYRQATHDQTQSIETLRRESDLRAEFSRTQRLVAEQAARDRTDWIDRAGQDAARKQRLTDAEELKVCTDAMDKLYDHSF